MIRKFSRRSLAAFFLLIWYNGVVHAQEPALAFLSDTQSPMWIEALAVNRNRNEEATAILVQHILQDTAIGMVVLLGDVTERSSSEKAWTRIDTFLHRFQERQRSVIATMGNHDYFLRASKGEANFKKRFPMYQRTGYCVRFHSLAIVLLNSNFSNLTDEEQKIQRQWYETTLDSLEADSTVSAVIVGCHHAPYTNNTVISPSKEVEKHFVPAFLRHSKCKAFMSGHSHAFEHFREGGKDFIVLGGGGGLQHALSVGKKQRWKDYFPQQTEKRMFHYIRCNLQSHVLTLTLMMLREDFSTIEPRYSIVLPLTDNNGKSH